MKKLMLILLLMTSLTAYSQDDAITREWQRQYHYYQNKFNEANKTYWYWNFRGYDAYVKRHDMTEMALCKKKCIIYAKIASDYDDKAQYYRNKIYERQKMFKHAKKCHF